MTTIQDRFRLRRGTAANLAAVNEVPLDSEIVIESDTGTADGARKFKIGDGVTAWNALPYFTLVDTVIRCRLATAAALPANTYANGSSGVGATLTMTSTGVLTVDGVATGLGDVLLVANEVASAHNGVYQVTTAGAVGVAAVLTRFARFVAPGAIPGRLLTVGPLGTANANTAWQSTTAAAPTVGTTSITFARVGGLGGSQFAVAGGTADALTATFGILPALVDGLQFSVRAASANATATPTFNPNSLGALTICKLGGGALRAGDIAGAGHELTLRYRASPARYELLNPRAVMRVQAGSHIAVDNTDPTSPSVAVTGLSAGTGYAEGTGFPASPGLNDKFYRTDLNLLCYYDGTQWLTVQEYQVDFTPVVVAPWSVVLCAIAGVDPDFGMYITRWLANTYVSSPNSPSNYWSLGLYYRTSADATILWKSQSTAADSPGRAVPHAVLVNSLLPSGTVLLQLGAVKTGAPGAFFPQSTLLYRRVVT